MENEIQGKIVVVDDNPATLYSTSRILRSAGYRVVEANTGNKGLAAVGPDTELLVLDINLPDIDGYQISRLLRSKPETSGLPILHLSATFVDEHDKVSGFEAGADAYLTHPVEPLVLLATARAIFRARKAEEATRQSEAKLRAIFDRAPSGIALLEEGSLTFADANPAMCSLLGRSREAVLGAGSFFDLECSGEQIEQIREQLESKGNWSGDFPCRREDGSQVDLEWEISTFSPRRLLALATDITERRRVESERARVLEREREARTVAEQANRLKDDFLATLSHELRNPLQTIVNWSNMLSRTTLDPSLKAGLDAMDRSAGMLTHLIEDLLDVARITSGKLNLEVAAVSIDSVLDAATEVVTPSAFARRIQIEREYAGRDAIVLGDAARLQQVAWNLISNAIKFTPQGGTVRIAATRSDTQVCFSVADDGCGIAAEFLPRIFERFSQEGGGQSRASGLGLGLAIVRHLVEMHGGKVEVSSPGPGQGSTFSVSLPLSLLQARPPAT